MKLENSCVVPVPRKQLWDYLMVIPNVAASLPGVEEVQALDERHYTGMVSLKVGIIRLKVRGKAVIELIDNDRYTASVALQGADQRISGLIQAKMTMNLEEITPEETKLQVQTDVSLLGKIGEFGQGIIKQKANQMMAEFAATLASKVRGEG